MLRQRIRPHASATFACNLSEDMVEKQKSPMNLFELRNISRKLVSANITKSYNGAIKT